MAKQLNKLKKLNRISSFFSNTKSKVLIIGISLFALFAVIGYVLLIKAYSVPNKIVASTISPNSFTVSFFTDWKTRAFLEVADNKDFKNSVKFNDIRDYEVNGLQAPQTPRNSHVLVATKLDPDKAYYYKVHTSFNERSNAELFVVKTAKVTDNIPSPQPIFGQVVDKDSKELADIIVEVHAEAATGEKSTSMISYTAANGSYSLDISNLRLADMSDYFKVKDNAPIKYVVTAMNNKESYYHEEYTLDNLTPVKTFVFKKDTNDYSANPPKTTKDLTSKLVSKATAASGPNCTNARDRAYDYCANKEGIDAGTCGDIAREVENKCKDSFQSCENLQDHTYGVCADVKKQDAGKCGNVARGVKSECDSDSSSPNPNSGTGTPASEVNYCAILHAKYAELYNNGQGTMDACNASRVAREVSQFKCPGYTDPQTCGPVQKPDPQPQKCGGNDWKTHSTLATFYCKGTEAYLCPDSPVKAAAHWHEGLCNYKPPAPAPIAPSKPSTPSPAPKEKFSIQTVINIKGSAVKDGQLSIFEGDPNTDGTFNGNTPVYTVGFDGNLGQKSKTWNQALRTKAYSVKVTYKIADDQSERTDVRRGVTFEAYPTTKVEFTITNTDSQVNDTRNEPGRLTSGQTKCGNSMERISIGSSTYCFEQNKVSKNRTVTENGICNLNNNMGYYLSPQNEYFAFQANQCDTSKKLVCSSSLRPGAISENLGKCIVNSSGQPKPTQKINLSGTVKVNGYIPSKAKVIISLRGIRADSLDIKDSIAKFNYESLQIDRELTLDALLVTDINPISEYSTKIFTHSTSGIQIELTSTAPAPDADIPVPNPTPEGTPTQTSTPTATPSPAYGLLQKGIACRYSTATPEAISKLPPSQRCAEGLKCVYYSFTWGERCMTKENGDAVISARTENPDCAALKDAGVGKSCQTLTYYGECNKKTVQNMQAPTIVYSCDPVERKWASVDKLSSKVQAANNNQAVAARSGETLNPGTYKSPIGTTISFTSPTKVNFYVDANGNGVRDSNEPIITGQAYTLQKQSEAFKYDLVNGWNALNFPFFEDTQNMYTASKVRAKAAAEGIEIESIKRWEGKWVEYTVKGSNVFGKDFAIRPNEGYFIKANKSSQLTLFGSTPTQPVGIQFLNGWALIGIAPGYGENLQKNYTVQAFKDSIQAFEFLKAVDALDSAISPDSLTRYDSGVYRGVNYVLGQDGKKREFGIDYPINEQNAYFVRAKKKTVFTP